MMGDAPAAIDLRRIPASYRAWNEILLDEFFPEGRHGAPVYFSVHDGVLNELGARHGRGDRDAFLNEVLSLAGLGQPFFVELSLLEDVWSAGRHGPPPFLAGLAVAVLAAGDMETDQSATRANYYVRLNALLRTPGRERPLKFERTVDMWRGLREWLRDHRRGELVLRGLETGRPAIDAAKSQCLVRSCDVEELVRAVRTFSGVAATMDPEELAPALRRYISGAGAQSRLSKLLGVSPSESALLEAAEALCSAVENWAPPEGVRQAGVREAEAPVRATLAIWPSRYPTLTWKRAEWLLRLPAVDEAEDLECLVDIGNDVRIARLDVRDPPSYDVKLLPEEVERILRGQLRVRNDTGDDVAPRLVAPLWFQDGSEQGRPGSWNLVERPSAGVPHLVVTLSTTSLEALRRAAAQPGTIAGDGYSWPGPGLHGAHSLLLEPGSVLPGNVTVVEQVSRLRMVGGLPLRRRVYLEGALPELVLPEGAVAEVSRLSPEPTTETVEAFAFSRTTLAEGPYIVAHGDQRAEIFVTKPHWRECHPPAIAELDRSVAASVDGLEVRGAIPRVLHARHTTHVRPGVSYRLYTTRMHKGASSPDGGIHEITTDDEHRDFTVVRVVRPAAPLPRAECFDDAGDDEPREEPNQDALDRLLEYLSAKGAGSLNSLRRYCNDLEPGRPWHTVLTTVEDLGHLDVCWDTGRWAVSPGAALPLAEDPQVCVFVGARARETVERLREWGVPAANDARALDPSRARAPACIFAPIADVLRAARSLAELRISLLTANTAPTIARHAKAVLETSWWMGPEFTPSSRVRQTLERWEPRPMVWRRHPDEAAIDGPALYRWREQGVPIHYLMAPLRRGRVRDFVAAKWWLAPSDRSSVVYEASLRRLLVPSAMGLPRILRRACTVASGLMPRREGRVLVYEGIPLNLAQTVAVRLNQVKAEGLW